MSEISAKDVMALRELTGCGLMECKKALQASAGDLQLAQQKMLEAGVIKAQKKSARTASEGVIAVAISDNASQAVMLEVNCETDFVARDENFINFVNNVLSHALTSSNETVEALLEAQIDGGSIESLRQQLVLKVGENIQLRRLVRLQAPAGGSVAHYIHGVRLGAIVALDVAAEAIGKDLAMHIAANRPKSIDENDFPQSDLDHERAIYQKQAAESNKPQDIQDKMVEGRMRKYLQEHTLLAQPFVKDPDVTVRDLLKPVDGNVLAFECFALGDTV